MVGAGDQSSVSVLLADDAPDLRFLVRHVLELGGMRVVAEATDGDEAVSCYRELGPEAPTVVLLDQQMPRLNGMEAAAQILTDSPTQLVVLFSADVTAVLQAQAAAVGIRACVSKTDITDLARVLSGIVATGSA